MLLRVAPSIAVDGAAGKVDEFVVMPRVLSIRADDSSIASDTSSIDLEGSEGRFEVEVTIPPDCAVTLDAEIILAEAA
jgi:hypothetical protein